MSSGGEQTSYRDNIHRDNSKADTNKPLEDNVQTNQSSSSGIASKPGKFIIFICIYHSIRNMLNLKIDSDRYLLKRNYRFIYNMNVYLSGRYLDYKLQYSVISLSYI